MGRKSWGDGENNEAGSSGESPPLPYKARAAAPCVKIMPCASETREPDLVLMLTQLCYRKDTSGGDSTQSSVLSPVT